MSHDNDDIDNNKLNVTEQQFQISDNIIVIANSSIKKNQDGFQYMRTFAKFQRQKQKEKDHEEEKQKSFPQMRAFARFQRENIF